MSENSNIEWTDHTFNPWIGCTKVSPGCLHCYAETQDKFRSWTPEGWGKDKPRRRTSEANWKQPLKWDREAAGRREAWLLHLELCKQSGISESDAAKDWIARGEEPWRHPRVFCASLADWLDDEVPIEWLADLMALIQATPNLDWLLLTKRPENWDARISQLAQFREVGSKQFIWELNWANGKSPENVWVGTTIEDSGREPRVVHLYNIPAKTRFLSCEPLLSFVDLQWPETVFPDGPERCCSGYECGCHGMPAEPPLISEIDWVICGGESGPGARPMNIEWARSLRDQCTRAGVPFLFKQWGEYNSEGIKVGKKKAGRLLDGVLWNEFPVRKETA